MAGHKSRGVAEPSHRAKASPEKNQRWDEIVHAAASIFFEKGYEATSLQDIAGAVGMLKGSIYYYINTKEDLLFDIVMRAQTIWRNTLEESEELAQSPAPKRLREYLLRWLQLRETEREWGIVAEREFLRLSPEFLLQVIAGRRQFSSFVESLVRQGVEEGFFDPNLDIRLSTSMVFELMKSSHLYGRPQRNVAVVDLADSYSRFVMRGLGCAAWQPDV